MSNFELNKIIAAILVAMLVCMIAGNVADMLYVKDVQPKVRGFAIDVKDDKNTIQVAALVQAPIDIPALMAKANADLGKDVIKKCIACHNVGENEPNKIGPHLWDVVGRDKASISDYSYSKPMQNKGGKWDYESLFSFLQAPSSYIPGTKMSFAGLSKPEDIANVIAFLRNQSHNPAPLPSASK